MKIEEIEEWAKKAIDWWSSVCMDVCVEGVNADQVYADKDACSDTVGDWLYDQGLEPNNIELVKAVVLSRI